MRVSAAFIALFLAGQVSAQTAGPTLVTYRIGIFAPGTTAPKPADVPLVELAVPVSGFTCGQPQAPATASPIVIGLTPQPWNPAVNDPADASKMCRGADIGPALTLATQGKLPACTTPQCPSYPVFAQVIDSQPLSSAWSTVGVPFFTVPAPAPVAPGQLRILHP